MRLLVCAGMTGGGVYPALAVLQSLKNNPAETLWVGSRSGMEQTLLNGYDLPYRPISGGGVHGMSPLTLPKNALQLLRGWQESKKIISDFKPEVCFYTGGYIGVPMAFAAQTIPSVVFVPDIEPGLALKLINSRATRICVSSELSRQYIPGKSSIQVTGYPLRKEITSWTGERARSYFGISENEMVLLVYGGSKGAQSINAAFIDSVEEILARFTVIHITGSENFKLVKSKIGSATKENYRLFPFLHQEIGAAFAAADLAVCRAGASTLGELPFFGLPAILVPYPHAWKYQHTNAQYLADSGGAIILEDTNLSTEFAARVSEILMNKRRLSEMSANMKSLSTEGAAAKIAETIQETAATNEEEKTDV